MVEISNGMGGYRTEFSSEELSTLNDTKILLLEGHIASQKNLTDSEAALASALRGEVDAIDNFGKVRAEKEKFFPKPTAYECILAARGIKKSPVVGVATHDETEAGARQPEGVSAHTAEFWDAKMIEAEEAVEDARTLVRSCRRHREAALKQVEKAIAAWHRETPPITFRQNLERERAADFQRKMDLIEQGLPPDYKPPRPTPQSMIDASAQHSVGGNINYRAGSQFRRNAHPRVHYGRTVVVAPKPKLPSDR